jgi:hypothetical protein
LYRKSPADEVAFDVVIPSMPGYGFSGKPTGTGWDPDHIARAGVRAGFRTLREAQ